MLIKSKDICKYAGFNPDKRKYVLGEKVLSSNQILKIGKNPEKCTSSVLNFTAYCAQSSESKGKPYEINGELTEGKVLKILCSCQGGAKGKCKHCIGTLLYICYRVDRDLPVLSCTDKKCVWMEEHNDFLENYKAVPFLKHKCVDENQKKTTRKIRQDLKKCQAKAKLSEVNRMKKRAAAVVASQTESLPNKKLKKSHQANVKVYVDPTLSGDIVGGANAESTMKDSSVNGTKKKNSVTRNAQSQVVSKNMHLDSASKENTPSLTRPQHDNLVRSSSNSRKVLRDLQNRVPVREKSMQEKTMDQQKAKTVHSKDEAPALTLKLSKNMEAVAQEILCSKLPVGAFTKLRLGRHYSIFKVEPNKMSADDVSIIKKMFAKQENLMMKTINELDCNAQFPCCLVSLQTLFGDSLDICVRTRDSFTEWKGENCYRVTGSICYNLYTYCSNKAPDWKEKCQDTFMPKDFKSEFCEYGRITEKKTREAFMVTHKARILRTGLIVSKLNPWVAYSPDGLIVVDGEVKSVLEIKCPIKGKTEGIDAVVASELKKCLKKTKFTVAGIDHEKIELRKKHRFYGQVQLGMAVVNVQTAQFVLYSAFDDQTSTLEIQRDETFIVNMLTKLKKAYFKHILPKKCLQTNPNSHHSRDEE